MTKCVLFAFVLVVFHLAASSRSDLYKKGHCPIVEESDLNCHREFVSECLVDFDCNGTTKCCRTACHQYKCVEPVSEKRLCHSFSDIAFVLDASGSIGKESFKKSKDMVKKMLQTFPHEKGYRHAVVVYGKKASIQFNFIASWDKGIGTKDLLDIVDKTPYYKSTMTRINAALGLVQEKIFPSYKIQKPRTQIIVLFTDGVQNTPPYREGLALAGKELEKSKIKVFAVLTGEQTNINALLKLCSNEDFIFEQEFLSELIEEMNSAMGYYC